MGITKSGSTIVYAEPENKKRAEKTDVHSDGDFAICDDRDVLRQLKFDLANQSEGIAVTLQAGAIAADAVIVLPSAAGTIEVGGTGAGAKNGATVSVVEKGNDALHQTVLTLASTPVPVISVTSAAGVGGYKVYTFPQGNICVLGTQSKLSLAIGAGKQDDFTDATPEGDIGVGSVVPANADALGSDATDDDYSTATTFDMLAFADASVNCPTEALQQTDGTAAAKVVNVNAYVDAGDIDDDKTSEIEVSGTITISWVNLGDF